MWVLPDLKKSERCGSIVFNRSYESDRSLMCWQAAALVRGRNPAWAAGIDFSMGRLRIARE